jgi:hypothetical protein
MHDVESPDLKANEAWQAFDVCVTPPPSISERGESFLE